MRDYSDEDTSAFSGITVQRIFALLEILCETTLLTETNIAHLYLQYSECFDDVLAFLIHLQLVEKCGPNLRLIKRPPFNSIPTLQAWLLSEIIHKNNNYGSEIREYLKNYKVEKQKLIFEATDHRRGRFSDVRNFLMEMGIVDHDQSLDRYILSTDYVFLYSFAKDINGAVSPGHLKISIAEKEGIGFKAECAILDYERHRLGEELASEIDHISLRNSAAGYDIKSFTLVNNDAVPRYIEVKAVPAISFRFYWTQNEIGVAKILRDLYFLYLLPVSGKGSFCLQSMKIIVDPYISVLKTPSDWATEANVMCCSLKQNGTASLPD